MKNLLTLIMAMAIAATGFAQDASNHDIALDYAKKGLYKKAIETIDVAIAEDEPRSKYFIDKAGFQFGNREYNNAEQTLNIGIDLFPDSMNIYLMRGGYYASLQHDEGAIADCEKALSLTDDKFYQIKILTMLGGLKSQVRRFDDAHKDLLKAYEIAPDDVDVLNNLATLSDEIGKPEDTFKYLEKIIELDPEYFAAYINLGFKYQLDGQHEKALTFFDKAIDMAPSEPLAYSNRSYSRLATKDVSGAMKDINLSISMFPSNSWAYKIRALIHIENGNEREACDDLNKAKELGYEKRYGAEVNQLIDKHCGTKM